MKPAKIDHELHYARIGRIDMENRIIVKIATATWDQLGWFWNVRAILREPFYERRS